jgi:uncharacterized protein (DUF58 family)
MDKLRYLLNQTSYFPRPKVYYAGFAISVLFMVSYFVPVLFAVAQLCLLFLVVAVAGDTLLLYSRRGIRAARICPDRFSNGDVNTVQLQVHNAYRFPVSLKVIDELPFQFQERGWERFLHLTPGQKDGITYTLRPVQRGAYHFGAINVLARSPLDLVSRRYRFAQEQTVKVYPSFLQVRRYQLLAAANRLQEAGIKRQRALVTASSSSRSRSMCAATTTARSTGRRRPVAAT